MPEVVIRRVVSEDECALIVNPKDDLLVKEVAVGDETRGLYEFSGTYEFDASDGAFTHYRRTLSVAKRDETSDELNAVAHIARGPGHDVVKKAETPDEPNASNGTAASYEIEETTSFNLSIPFWSGLLNLPMKREFSRPRSASPRQLWWMPSQRLDERSGHVLGVLCLMSLVTGYLGVLLSQTLTFVADEFNADKGTQGIVLSAVRLGIPLAFGVTFLADRLGRQPLLRFGLVGAYLVTALTAASVGIWMFGISQGVARGLVTASALLIGIIAAEEMPAGARAYAASILSMCAGLGAGVMVWFIWVADLSLTAWRFLYLIPLLAAPGLVWMLRALPETRRYEIAAPTASDPLADNFATSDFAVDIPTTADPPANSATTESPTDPSVTNNTPATNSPIAKHAPANPDMMHRLLLLGGALFLLSIFTTPASQFLNEYLRDERDFSGVQLVAFQLLTNTPAGISLYLAGRWADKRGRRQIAMVALLGMAAFTTLKFSAAGWPMWGWGLGSSLFAAAMVPVIGVYGPELFATSQRGRSNGILTVIGVAGGALGLLLVGQLAERWDSFGQVFAIFSVTPLAVIALVFFLFPETAQKELETLNPTDKAPG